MNYENLGSGKLSLFHAFDSVYLRLEVYGWPEGEPNEVKWFEAKKGCKSSDDESLLVSAELAEKLESEFSHATPKKALKATAETYGSYFVYGDTQGIDPSVFEQVVKPSDKRFGEIEICPADTPVYPMWRSHSDMQKLMEISQQWAESVQCDLIKKLPAKHAWISPLIAARAEIGYATYGNYLRWNNPGRDAEKDLRDELLDALVYAHERGRKDIAKLMLQALELMKT